MSEAATEVIELAQPDSLELDEEATVVAYVNSDGELLFDDAHITTEIDTPSIEDDFNQINAELKSKAHDLSRQSPEEIGDGVLTRGFTKKDIVSPPYPPKCLANFLEVDPVFSRAVKAKVLDSVGRDYRIQARLPVNPDSQLDPNEEDAITPQQFRGDINKITSFIDNSNDTIGFRGVLERAAMDYESLGWAGLEVIRQADGKVAALEHIPAQRLRVLKGFSGFVEVLSNSTVGDSDYRCYQRFGQKFLVAGTPDEVYCPEKHGPIEDVTLVENFIDFRNGNKTTDFNKSANEIIYIPKHHSNTIYYGYSDVLPALGAIVGNVYIRDYILQFFEHNTIPRYAVIIKGAKIDDSFRKMITAYFSDHVKGSAHKTLILTLQGQSQKQVEIEFKELDTRTKEADFLETQKQNDNRIMVAMGTSPAILGIADSSELGSGKGLSQAEIYKDRIVTPCQRHWAEKLNMLFRKGLGVQYAVLQFDPLDIRDRFSEMQVLTGYQDRGDLTHNEVREMADLGGAIRGGNTPFVRIKDGTAFKIEDLPDLPSFKDRIAAAGGAVTTGNTPDSILATDASTPTTQTDEDDE